MKLGDVYVLNSGNKVGIKILSIHDDFCIVERGDIYRPPIAWADHSKWKFIPAGPFSEILTMEQLNKNWFNLTQHSF